jgi:putative ABC transport system permease protein
MTAAHRKVLSDLSQEGVRTVLVVFATAAGIAGFLAVLSAFAVLTRELNRGYLATNPASASLQMDSVDDGLLAAVRANPEIGAADARRNVAGRIRTAKGDWHTLKLFVMNDFAGMKLSKVDPELGKWPPSTGDLLIERDALGITRAQVGDTVTVKTAHGKEQTLRLSGSVHDVGQAQARMENIVYGYITLDTLAQLGEASYLDRLNIVVAANGFDKAHIQDVAVGIRKLAERRGHVVRGVDIPNPGEHPHAHVMGLLLLAMSSFGFGILAMSGVLVVNMVTATMALQIRQIGVMKAIGAGSGQVAAIYLKQTLQLGTAAIVVAIPIGVVGGRALCRSMAGFLNFDMASFAAPVWVYLLAALAGWGVPLLAAAVPVWQGSRVSVRLALAGGRTSSTFGESRFDRAVARAGGPLRPVLLAFRNSLRRRIRLALTMTTLVAGGVFFLAGLDIRTSMIHTLDDVFATRKFDLTVNLGATMPLDKLERAVGNTAGVSRSEGWIVTDGSLGKTERFTVTGLPTKTRLMKLQIVEGRDLAAGDTDAMVVNAELAGRNKSFAVGQRVSLRISQAYVVVRVVGMAREGFSPPGAYVPRELAGRSGTANVIRVALDRTDHASLEIVKTALGRNLELEGFRAESMSGTADARFAFDQHMVMIYVFLVVVAAIIAGIGGLGLMTTMSLNVLERRREIGVLRAIGAAPRDVLVLVITEGVAMAVASWAIAAIAAWPVARVLGDFLWTRVFTAGLDFRFEPSGLGVWLAASLVIGTVGSLWPAWNASRITVREALSHE